MRLEIEVLPRYQRELTPISQVKGIRGAETLFERCCAVLGRWRDSLSQLVV